MLICVRLFVFVCSVLFVVWHCRSQYKGRFNFWRLGHGHLEMNGISQWHDFPASHHFAGPHDSIGKHPGIEIGKRSLRKLDCTITIIATSGAESTCQPRRLTKIIAGHGLAMVISRNTV